MSELLDEANILARWLANKEGRTVERHAQSTLCLRTQWLQAWSLFNLEQLMERAQFACVGNDDGWPKVCLGCQQLGKQTPKSLTPHLRGFVHFDTVLQRQKWERGACHVRDFGIPEPHETPSQIRSQIWALVKVCGSNPRKLPKLNEGFFAFLQSKTPLRVTFGPSAPRAPPVVNLHECIDRRSNFLGVWAITIFLLRSLRFQSRPVRS